MNLNKISDKIVFETLKFIKYGSIKIVNYDNQSYDFGNPKEDLKVKLKVNKPGLTYQIIKVEASAWQKLI